LRRSREAGIQSSWIPARASYRRLGRNDGKKRGSFMNQTIGKRFPDLELAADDGKKIKLSEIAANFPLILIFYRGHW